MSSAARRISGVAGKDILLEYAPDVYELLDLNMGKCRMCVAGPKDFVDSHTGILRVATKFPNIARRHYATESREIDVIRLNGSIELAPILGLSDVIVDIVETGKTLAENGLGVLEEIVPISARLIANKAHYKFKGAEIHAAQAGPGGGGEAMKIVNLNETDKSTLFLRTLEDSGVGETVSQIIRDVAQNGDSALLAYAKKFDRAELSDLEVTEAEMTAALDSIPGELADAMQTAAENIRAFHSMQLREGFRLERPNGVYMGQKITPIEKVGLYIPGGTASYPSTVFMNAIPAKLAGCGLIVMVSPPNANGQIAAPILAAAKLAGVDRVFKAGGAQAVAALAYGTASIPRVDKIVGPGNAYVAEAKRQVFGRVAIDMIAGPSEILVVADETANPAFVAADLLSQAEHDALSSAVLITNSRALAEAVSDAVERQLKTLPREAIARASIENNGKIILTDDLLCAIDLANDLAPEHLEALRAGAGALSGLCEERGIGLSRQLLPGGAGGLSRRAEPHAADERNRAVFKSLECRRFCEKDAVHLFFTGGARGVGTKDSGVRAGGRTRSACARGIDSRRGDGKMSRFLSKKYADLTPYTPVNSRGIRNM